MCCSDSSFTCCYVVSRYSLSTYFRVWVKIKMAHTRHQLGLLLHMTLTHLHNNMMTNRYFLEGKNIKFKKVMSSDYNSLEYILPVSASKDTHSPNPKKKKRHIRRLDHHPCGWVKNSLTTCSKRPQESCTISHDPGFWSTIHHDWNQY